MDTRLPTDAVPVKTRHNNGSIRHTGWHELAPERSPEQPTMWDDCIEGLEHWDQQLVQDKELFDPDLLQALLRDGKEPILCSDGGAKDRLGSYALSSPAMGND